MSESPIRLRGKSGGVVFDGTQSPGGGSQPVEVVRVALAFDTPGLVIPATGPAGLKVADLAEGDAFTAYQDNYFSVQTAWNGTDPVLAFMTDSGRGDLPDSPVNDFNPCDLTVADAAPIAGVAELKAPTYNTILTGAQILYAVTATGLYVYVQDGSGGDPGSDQGAGELVLQIVRANA